MGTEKTKELVMPFVTHRAAAPLAICAALLAIAIAAVPAAAAKPKTKPLAPVHVRGTVYTFDNQEPIAGATVKVDELPGLSATSGPDGRYDLVVPDGTRVTLFAEAAGHRGLHTQTFVTEGRDLERVNHQIPTIGTYDFLKAILAVPVDANGDPLQCVVVSTFSTVNVREVSFEEFVAYGAHGVAGATGFATPALPKPTYFNDFVIPDPSRTESSVDGGVIWTGVPAGVYRFGARHASTRFAGFRATCVNGRVVNANPPQGLYELRPGEELDTAVDARLARPSVVGHGSRLKVKASGGEYVSVAGELLKGAKRVGRSVPKGYRPGPRRLFFKLGDGLAGRKLKVRVTAEDGEGNVTVLQRKLRVPRADA
ncbi:MAG: hypothetical protein ACXWFN_12575 [Solirubrobacterales bacterium]